MDIIKSNNDFINILDKSGETALIIACKNGYIQIVELLVISGTDVHIRTTNCVTTSLKLACIMGHYEIVKFLLENGAESDVNIPCFSVIHV